ncbi:MAG: hypothetical protein OEV49_01620 [candidate division Zixibacteria bacterium]|nr:hypothetical protein [candidate division Zixibacteria bacterium]MDH3935989.1 hypothetical protein [candidate division Zixibacteria bacterium]MDH4035754.1 hypothetical protein [candidate division Zixibacteria bacterium]
MTSENSDKQTEHKDDGYDRHDINVRWVGAITIITIIVIAGSVIALYEYFVYEKERQIYELTLEPESEKLLELRVLEEKTLTTYELKPSVTGTYRIPIDSALKLMAEENSPSRATSGGNR